MAPRFRASSNAVASAAVARLLLMLSPHHFLCVNYLAMPKPSVSSVVSCFANHVHILKQYTHHTHLNLFELFDSRETP